MLITKGSYKNNYVIERAGIFGSIGNFFYENVSTNAAKQLAWADLQAGKLRQKILE